MADATRKRSRFGPFTIIIAFLLYGLTAVLAVYIGTIAMLPQGAILGLAMFALATYALSVFFRRPEEKDDDLDDEDA